MAFGLVTVLGPADRDVYINGNYADPAGKTGGEFSVEYGPNVFETLDGDENVDLRAEATVNDDHPHVTVTLQPV